MTEVHIEDELVVAATPEAIWRQIEDPGLHAEWHPFATRIEGEHRAGATRTCHVRVGKKTGRTRERCTIAEPQRRIAWQIEEDSTGFLRFASDWSAGFRLDPVDGGTTRVTAESTFTPRNLLARLMLPMVRRKFHQAQRAILAALGQAAAKPAA